MHVCPRIQPYPARGDSILACVPTRSVPREDLNLTTGGLIPASQSLVTVRGSRLRESNDVRGLWRTGVQSSSGAIETIAERTRRSARRATQLTQLAVGPVKRPACLTPARHHCESRRPIVESRLRAAGPRNYGNDVVLGRNSCSNSWKSASRTRVTGRNPILYTRSWKSLRVPF